ncbi:hypothetical protein D3C77_419340 [compost metagenome]
MGMQLLDQLKRFLAVGGFADNLEAVLLPVQNMLNSLPHQYFVVNNEYSVQFTISH